MKPWSVMARNAPSDIDARLAETNHRVANSLQLAVSILMRDATKVADPAARAVIRETVTRVSAIALLHRALLVPPEQGFAFDAYLHTVLDTLRATFCAERGISLLTQADPVDLDPDNATLVGLVVHELVMNAIKHGFVGRRGGTVQVACGYDRDGAIWIEVEDNGVGMPRGAALRPGSSGVGLAVALLASVDATIALGDAPTGTKFVIKLPATLGLARQIRLPPDDAVRWAADEVAR
jgi:two-component sensor histidine kinase